MRLTPRLLLQIQQLSSSNRALPILEIYQPPTLGKHLPHCPRKLHSRDLYVLQSDAYTNLPSAGTASHQEGGKKQDPSSSVAVAGVIYTNPSSADKLVEIFIPSTSQTWSITRTPANATAAPASNYKFTLTPPKNTTDSPTPTPTTANPLTLEWKKRTRSRTRSSTARSSLKSASGSTSTSTSTSTDVSDANQNQHAGESEERFVLSVSGAAMGSGSGGVSSRPTTTTVLAGLERKGVRVGGWDARQVRVLEEVLGGGAWKGCII
ncbi:hypothetical protein BO70DRAFT_428041 [Aspergillus heteromorphus CBS 117.55]|uniref:Uncharacterized protein n=1 Tax=Aspergillus heteromorphus CBS 117.55 TaxID=1448321 RepID=A0A317WIS9_9EURO|nr:uncharacterized protein BO70DRAFT_428041 [Aspergillus heteromorphus CBS 117.55]PWY85955.1 hypothetical protein BO70DRAFT_428041 [Aspergillus heteromorphus CBS 117.55]